MDIITTDSAELTGYIIEQKEKIKELRERLKASFFSPEQIEDNYLIKWLIARNYDVDAAEIMLKKHIRFVKSNGLDKIDENYVPNEVFDYFYTALLGYDKDGSVVRILHVGSSDLRSLCMCISQMDCLRYAHYTLVSDHHRQKTERQNMPICDKQVYILDLEGLSFRTIIQRNVVNRAFVLLKSYEANHPERLKVAYIVNAPSFFSFIFSWLKTVLPESIISKIEVFSHDDCLRNSALNKVIDPSILPASLGGHRKDPDGDPKCKTLFKKPLGTPVPEDMLPDITHNTLQNDPEAKQITIDYGSVFILEKVISVPNTILLWDFVTLNYDIRMGLRYKQGENGISEELIPPHRVDSHLMQESGNFICEQPGIYEIVFDNSYSWMTRKELIVKVHEELQSHEA